MLANLCHDDYSVIVKVKIATDVLATAEQHSMNQDGIGEAYLIANDVLNALFEWFGRVL